MFAVYQDSGMETTKWHDLNRVVKVIRLMGGIEYINYINGGMYETAHKKFKEGYQLTSKILDIEMRETKQKNRTELLLRWDVKMLVVQRMLHFYNPLRRITRPKWSEFLLQGRRSRPSCLDTVEGPNYTGNTVR